MTLGGAERFKPAFTLEQITQVRTLGQFAISADGSRAAFGLAGHYFGFATVPRFGEENNLRIVTVGSGRIVQVTSGSKPKTAPAFSRGGSLLAYEEDGDVWITDLSSGRSRRITTNAASDGSASWSPDGRQLAFVSSRGGRSDIWIVPADGEDASVRRLTSDTLIKDDPQWSPDGTAIAFVGKRSDEFYSQGIFVAPSKGGAATRLTPDDGFDSSMPRWSPDGSQIAFVSDRSGYAHVWTMAADGTHPVEFDTADREATAAYWAVAPVWSHDGRRILVSVNHHSRYELVVADAAAHEVTTIGEGPGQYHEVGWSADDRPVYAYENAWSPPDLFVGTPAEHRQLTYSGHIVFTKEHMGPAPERVSFPSLDGFVVHGSLLKPAGLRPGERRPGLVLLHPNGYGQFYDQWAPFYQYLAESGYVVLLFDQRGSAGYGRKYREAQIGAWGRGTFDDVKAAAAFIKQQPSVDPDHLGVLGMSYGGYQALLAYTKTPDLFQAVVDIAGNSDRRSNRGDKYRALQIGATEEEDPDLYSRISPITSVADATAPLLILQGEADRNVAPEQTYRLVNALEALGKPFEVFMYPGEPHALNQPANQLDSYRQIMRFFDRYLRPR
jgi:dipeptidyl aminopeptidase/acylaminoacyl peptidase